VVAQLELEARQVLAQVVEDAAGADLPRRVARVEADQRRQVREDALAHQRLTSAHSVLLMP
jgi:hypothetical protein